MFDIVGIEGDLFSECVLISTVHLSHPRDTWFDSEDLFVRLIIEFDLTGLMRTWSYERHISSEYIPELWELIDRESLDDTTEPHFSRIIFYLVERSFSGIFFSLELLLILHCIVIYPVFFLGTI